jgi:hypothetical protein
MRIFLLLVSLFVFGLPGEAARAEPDPVCPASSYTIGAGRGNIVAGIARMQRFNQRFARNKNYRCDRNLTQEQPTAGLLFSVVDPTQESPYSTGVLKLWLGLMRPDGSVIHYGDLETTYYLRYRSAPFLAQDGTIYFLTESGELARMDPLTGKERAMPLPGIVPFSVRMPNDPKDEVLQPDAESVSDAEIFPDGRIVYLRGRCQGYDACSLWSLGNTGMETMLLADVPKALGSNGYSVIRLEGYDRKTGKVRLEYSGREIDWSHGGKFDVDPADGSVTQTVSAEKYHCDDIESLTCDAERLGANKHYDLHFPHRRSILCHGMSVTTDRLYETLTIRAGGRTKIVKDAYVLGCQA